MREIKGKLNKIIIDIWQENFINRKIEDYHKDKQKKNMINILYPSKPDS